MRSVLSQLDVGSPQDGRHSEFTFMFAAFLMQNMLMWLIAPAGLLKAEDMNLLMGLELVVITAVSAKKRSCEE